MDNPAPFDVLRVLCLVLGSFTVAAVLVVTVAYAAIWRRHAVLYRRGEVEAWRGMLPRHVVAVSTSYVGLAVMTMVEVADRLRTDPTYRPVVYAVLYLIGLWSMWEVLGHARYRTRSYPDRRTRP
jgi:hypothetical protein